MDISPAVTRAMGSPWNDLGTVATLSSFSLTLAIKTIARKNPKAAPMALTKLSAKPISF